METGSTDDRTNNSRPVRDSLRRRGDGNYADPDHYLRGYDGVPDTADANNHAFKHAPKKLVLDFDATDDVVHGKHDCREAGDTTPWMGEVELSPERKSRATHGGVAEEGRFFHGYYDHYCFLPLYVFCRDQLLFSYLRPSKIDGAKHAWAILSLLVKRLRAVWPKVRIIFRGDSGFCRWRMLSWCERHDIGYIVGIA